MCSALGDEPAPKACPVGFAAARDALRRREVRGERELHVDAARGSDDGDGSAERPFKTISAAARVATAGTVIRVAPGRYAEAVRIGVRGTPAGWVRFVAEGKGETVLDGEHRLPGPNWEGLITVQGAAHVEIAGFRVVGSTAAGVFIERSSNVVVRGVSTLDTWSSGVQAWRSTGVEVLGNTVRRACQGRTRKGHGTQECITLASCTNSRVAYNHVYDRQEETGDGGEGIDCKQACRGVIVHHNLVHHLVRLGIYVDAYDRLCADVRVVSNVVHDCASGIVVSAERRTGRVNDVEIRANTVFDNRRHGIEVSDYDGDAPRARIRIFDNRLWNNGRPAWGGGISVMTRNPDAAEISITGNVCHENVAWQICVATNVMDRVFVSGNWIRGFRGYDGGTEREIWGLDPVSDYDPARLKDFLEPTN